MTVTYVIVKGQADDIANWLWDFTDYTGTGREPPHFPTETGRIVLDYLGDCAEWPDEGRFQIRIRGYLVPPGQDKATRDNLIRGIIIFRTLPLDSERVEVAAECNHPAVTGHVEQVLTELKKRWPDVTVSRGRVLPDRFPKKPETITRYKKAYLIMVELRRQYRESYDEFLTSTPTPTTQDYKDALASKMGWRPCDKTIRRIRKFGDEGLLK